LTASNELLNRWLTRYASQSERRDAARTFVVDAPHRPAALTKPVQLFAHLSAQPEFANAF
jgi:hypothetical protein